MGEALDFSQLKAKHRALRDDFSQSLTLRIHRSLSWLGRAEGEKNDADVAFMLLWVSFNAAYAEEIDLDNSEKDNFQKFFEILVSLDKDQRIYNLVWTRFAKEIRLLLDNQHIFAPFWKCVNGDTAYADWQLRMSKAKEKVNFALRSKETAKILSILFDRLYVLRNQIVHGGATWNSSVNRAQVNDGRAFLANIIPVFIDIMMANPQYEWRMPFYTVVE